MREKRKFLPKVSFGRFNVTQLFPCKVTILVRNLELVGFFEIG